MAGVLPAVDNTEANARVEGVLSGLKRLPGVEAVARRSRPAGWHFHLGALPRTLGSATIAALSAGLAGTADVTADEMGRGRRATRL